MLVTPPIDPNEIALFETLKISISPIALRLLGILFLTVNAIMFSGLFKKRLIPFLIFLLNPWSLFIHTFFTVQSLLLTLTIVLFSKRKWVPLSILCIISLFLFSRSLSESYRFLPKLKPSTLAFEINERQKIDFLATGKTYILPAIIRKITYNKPLLAIDKIGRHFVSFFDFEHLAYPLESYEIIKLSGISPKGNFPLLFIWEIPLIVYGIVKNKKLLPFLLITFVPAFAGEKKVFGETAFLTLPILLYWEAAAVGAIRKRFNPKLFWIVVSFIIVVFVFPHLKNFYTKPMMFKNPESYYYRQIAEWIKQNSDKKIVVTTIFGPTEKMIKLYMKNIPANVSFSPFNLVKQNAESEIYYIGLPGQFVTPGKNLTIDRSSIPVVGVIEGGEEIVFNYGESIWIGSIK